MKKARFFVLVKIKKTGGFVKRSILISLSIVVIAICPAAVAMDDGELLGPGVISSPHNETSAALTSDGKTIYFMRADLSGRDNTILFAKKVQSSWSTPRVASFSGQWKDSEPHFSADGKYLFFVSNRPTVADGKSLTLSLGGQTYPGTNLWMVERRGGQLAAPKHAPGEVNSNNAVFNPSTTLDGSVYFSSIRADSGTAGYQIYRSQWDGKRFLAPKLVLLGKGLAVAHMDPAIDPAERFIVFAGNEGESLGSADIYISFKQTDGTWATPENLGPEVNSEALENAPSLGAEFGEIFITSMRSTLQDYPKPTTDTAKTLEKRLRSPLNGSRNIWRFNIAARLKARGLRAK